MILTDLQPQYLEQASQLYESAFPEIERRPTPQWKELMQTRPEFQARAIVADDGDFCGFITTWHFKDFVYGEHFAIRAEKRNGGVGGQAFDLLRELCGTTDLVLEVELPDNEMARRRIGFYQRHGMSLIHREYLQPPYRPGGEYFPLRLMSTNPERTLAAFAEIERTIHREVYGAE